MTLGFTLHDLFGATLAVMLFPLVAFCPGYVFGWASGIFQFRTRSRFGRYVIAVVLSNSVLPIIAFIIYRYLSYDAVVAMLAICALVFLFLELFAAEHLTGVPTAGRSKESSTYRRTGLAIAAAWVGFSLLLLVDLQFGSRLYFSTPAYDYTSRIAVVDAITRTGVPPLNPSYYPGFPVKMTYLYYYWYIAGSLIDKIGGPLVSSGQALLAAIAWCGLGLMSTLALYLHLRTSKRQDRERAPILGVQLLLVSGLDFIPVVGIAVRARQVIGQMVFNGRIEGWNMPIMSWLNAITWVPNHVCAAAQCLAAMAAILSVHHGTRRQQAIAGVFSGLALASALGSSVWVTLTFAVAWIAWALTLLWSRKQMRLVLAMCGAGLLGALLSIPFIADIMRTGGVPAAGLPVGFYVRPFVLGALLFPIRLQPIANLLLLPLNYLMELGLFAVLGIYWLQHRKEYEDHNPHFFTAEIILLTTVVALLSFVRSTVLPINDLGIRAWLLGQFVLLIWGVDVIRSWLRSQSPSPVSIFQVLGRLPRIGLGLQGLLVIGILSTALEAFSTRAWPMLVDLNIAGFPNDLSPDTSLGARTYAARLAYEYIDSNTPQNIVIQNNPDIVLDRPSGLYGNRQMVISDRTFYGVPLPAFRNLQSGVAAIFKYDRTWAELDAACSRFGIDMLVVSDLDPLWQELPVLLQSRAAGFRDAYEAVISCRSGS